MIDLVKPTVGIALFVIGVSASSLSSGMPGWLGWAVRIASLVVVIASLVLMLRHVRG
jgi:hypothetical protein